jgi:hypothetical protein
MKIRSRQYAGKVSWHHPKVLEMDPTPRILKVREGYLVTNVVKGKRR